MTAMILLVPLPVTWRHLRLLRRPVLDVLRSDRLTAWAVVSAWLLPVVAAWASAPGSVTVMMVAVLVWLIVPPVLAVAALRSRRAEQREDDLLRATNGLAARRHLASPWQVGAAWGAIALTLMAIVAVGPALATAPGQPVQHDIRLLYLVCIPVLLGAVHVITQQVRREREADRAAAADRRAVDLGSRA
ncbi:hypothetical protein OG871_39530 (plasmid) [Kitasatospora sp. NBC_00374]|uniref:hypothetical protein n=1 Tax=Kitasatospora sp. NBC_00374 TaxID=2975964 RepID=UPI00324A6C1A